MTTTFLRAVQIATDLIAFPTVSGHPRTQVEDWHGIYDYVVRLFDGCRARVQLLPQTLKPDVAWPPGLLITVGPCGVPGVVISGHLDVVPVDGQPWNTDPFRLTEKDGAFYGRGACDMKGPIAAALAVVLAADAKKLSAPVHFLFTCDEEIGMHTANALSRDILKLFDVPPLGCVVIEPTELQPITAHKGYYHFQILFHGVAAHSSNPAWGLDALKYAARFYAELQEKIPAYLSALSDARFDVPQTTMNIGKFSAGEGGNIVPSAAQFDVEFRPIPGFDMGPLLAGIQSMQNAYAAAMHEEAAEKALMLAADPVQIIRTESTPALSLGDNNPWLAQALAMMAIAAPTGSVGFCTEASHWMHGGLPALVFGPGSIKHAHKPNERISCDELTAGIAFFERMMDKISQP